jgi:prolipoprotein diacylglyceryl transferase
MLTLIPSPTRSVWYLGPLPLRAYALAIIIGIVVAWWIGTRRYAAKGGRPEAMMDVVLWAVPFGIVGGRLYHVITSPEAFFGAGGRPLDAFKIWQGGLGIWGAIALGGLGAWIGARRAGVRFAPIADCLAPAILVAQGIGRLGNWFNEELFGGPTTLPWGLQVSDAAAVEAGFAPGTLFHPTFLYELLWDFAAAGLLIVIERRWRLGHGRTFLAYVALYCAGRLWIEMMRIDPAHRIAGLRLNVWTSAILGVAALVGLVLVGRRHGGPDTDMDLPGSQPPAADGLDLSDRPDDDAAAALAETPKGDEDSVVEPDKRPVDLGSGEAADNPPGRAGGT